MYIFSIAVQAEMQLTGSNGLLLKEGRFLTSCSKLRKVKNSIREVWEYLVRWMFFSRDKDQLGAVKVEMIILKVGMGLNQGWVTKTNSSAIY